MEKKWTIVDTESKGFTPVTATTQKEAIRKGVKQGYIPERSTHARPRTGDAELMTREEFNEFMQP